MLIYVIARSDTMNAHQVSDARQQEIASIAELADLKDRGILTEEEFRRATRQRQLSQNAPPSPDEDIAELESLKDRGLLSEEEFQRAKDLLGAPSRSVPPRCRAPCRWLNRESSTLVVERLGGRWVSVKT